MILKNRNCRKISETFDTFFVFKMNEQIFVQNLRGVIAKVEMELEGKENTFH